jgi:hypothetical protein
VQEKKIKVPKHLGREKPKVEMQKVPVVSTSERKQKWKMQTKTSERKQKWECKRKPKSPENACKK